MSAPLDTSASHCTPGSHANATPRVRSIDTHVIVHDDERAEAGQHMYVATHTVYVSCSASVPFFTWYLENTAAVRRIATQYSFNSSSVGSERTKSAGDVPGRTTGKDSSVSVPAGSSGSMAAVGLYLTFSVSLPRSVALGPANNI